MQNFIKRHPHLSAWFINFCYSAYQMSWMRGTRLTDIAPDVPIVKVSFILVYIIFTLAFSLCLPLAVWLYRRLRLSWQEPKALFILPALWVVAEFLQSSFFSLIIYGNYGHIGSYIVIGSLGYNLVQTPLIYLSRLGGLWILTGVVVFFCIAILQLLFVPKARLNILLALIGIVLVCQASYILWRNPTGTPQSIAVVQIGTNQNITSSDPTINPQIATLPERSADIIVMPEYSHYFDFTPQADIQAVSRIASSSQTPIIDSYQDRTKRPFINYVSYRSPDSSRIFRQHKWFLAPGGEYLPYFITGLLKLTNNQPVIDKYVFERQVSSAQSPEMPFAMGAVKIGALACSGVVSPEVYRGMASRGATILTNSGSLDTVGLSSLYHNQTEMLGRLHAVANARPFVQSARGSYSFIYDHNGNQIVRDSSFTTKAMLGSVQTNDAMTPYTLFGNWLPIGLIGYITILLTKARQRKATISSRKI